MSNIVLALQITIVGMSLIFFVILLLWFMLGLLVFVLGKTSHSAHFAGDVSTSLDNPVEGDEESIRQEAVAAAVSTALMRKSLLVPGHFPLPPTAIVSAWQAVLRGNMLSKRGHLK